MTVKYAYLWALSTMLLFACKKDTLDGTVAGNYKGVLYIYPTVSGGTIDTLENQTVVLAENDLGLIYNGDTIPPKSGGSNKDYWFYEKIGDWTTRITYFTESEQIYLERVPTSLTLGNPTQFSGSKQ